MSIESQPGPGEDEGNGGVVRFPTSDGSVWQIQFTGIVIVTVPIESTGKPVREETTTWCMNVRTVGK